MDITCASPGRGCHGETHFAAEYGSLEFAREDGRNDRLVGRAKTNPLNKPPFQKGTYCSIFRHSAENIAGHAAARVEIGPDTFPLLGCADLLFCPPHRATALHRVWDSLDTTTCARAPRKCASSWARTCFSLFSHRPRTKERFHNSGRATLAIGSDAIIRLNSVRQTRSRQAGRKASFSLPT